MQEIVEGIYVGTVSDIQCVDISKFSILDACKEPLHRLHAKLDGSNEEGYLGRAMPRNSKEYLYAERDHALYCNLIDAPDPKYISDEIIDRALRFIEEEIAQGRKVLIVCNKAESRSPSIALMWCIVNGILQDWEQDANYVMRRFKEICYPPL